MELLLAVCARLEVGGRGGELVTLGREGWSEAIMVWCWFSWVFWCRPSCVTLFCVVGRGEYC